MAQYERRYPLRKGSALSFILVSRDVIILGGTSMNTAEETNCSFCFGWFIFENVIQERFEDRNWQSKAVGPAVGSDDSVRHTSRRAESPVPTVGSTVDHLPTHILHLAECVFTDGERENDFNRRRSQRRRRRFILNLCCIDWIAHLTLTSSKILGYSDHVPWIPQACPALSHRLKWRAGLTSPRPAAVHLRPWNFLQLRSRCRSRGGRPPHQPPICF